MTLSIKTIIATAGLLAASFALAQTPATAPAGSTGLCNDGTYYTGATKRGACHGHKGVKDWYGATAAATPVAPAATAPAAAPAAATAPAATPAAATAPAKPSAKTAFTPPATAAPGGGPGLVWGNESSKVYHCSTDRWYGKTKHGKYMTEADAKAAGYRPDHGKACQ